MKSALVFIVVICVITGIMSIPREVEGLYWAGTSISCMCDGTHYIRFYGGSAIHYSTAHEPAELLGRYEVKSDGSVEVYIPPLMRGETEELLFTLGRPRIGFVYASPPEKSDSYVLFRVPTTEKISDMIARQEVSQVFIPDKSRIVTTYYDSFLSVVRKETKAIKKRQPKE